MIDPQIENRVALVSGANHGIGASIAAALAVQGVKVFVTYHRTDTPGFDPDNEYRVNRAKDASDVVKTIRADGGLCEAQEADLSLPETIPALFDAAEEAFGPVEILVNNAAHWEPATFNPRVGSGGSWMDTQGVSTPLMSAEAHDKAFAVNARGSALMMLEFAQRHVKRQANWGRIINISTDAARQFPKEATYGASKHALESYSRTAATELGQFGVTVNIVSPGPIQTGYLSEASIEQLTPHIPLGRIGYPADVADVVVFLSSHQARWVTGQLIHVGGGHRM